MLDKYFKLLQNNKNKKNAFVEAVFEVCNIKSSFYKFEFVVNKEDLIKIKIIAASAIKFTILKNQEEIKEKFKEKLNKLNFSNDNSEILILII